MRRNQNGEALEKGHFQAEEIAGYESPMRSKSSALPPTKGHKFCEAGQGQVTQGFRTRVVKLKSSCISTREPGKASVYVLRPYFALNKG